MKMKKTNKILLPVLALTLLAGGCRKHFEAVDAVDFEVTTVSQTFKVGEAVRFFNFEGDPDFIIFYSGERGNEYAFKDKDRITDTEMTFTFTTTTSSGTPGYSSRCRSAIRPISRANIPKGAYVRRPGSTLPISSISPRIPVLPICSPAM